MVLVFFLPNHLFLLFFLSFEDFGLKIAKKMSSIAFHTASYTVIECSNRVTCLAVPGLRWPSLILNRSSLKIIYDYIRTSNFFGTSVESKRPRPRPILKTPCSISSFFFVFLLTIVLLGFTFWTKKFETVDG